MRAGLLREVAVFKHQATTTGPSGAQKKEWVDYLTTKAYRKKLSSTAGINVSEQFISSTVILQVRHNAAIVETDRVVYNGKTFSIVTLDRQIDNTILLTLSKVNN